MVTDLKSNYTSPAGRECTLAAGRFAAVNPASTVLDIGCGYGEGACNLAAEFRCKITAIDQNADNIQTAREQAAARSVSHLITFKVEDVCGADYHDSPFDLVLAEGGILSFIGRAKGIGFAHQWLAPRGWFAFSDLILLSEKIPDEVKTIFETDRFAYETESSYRSIIKDAGFDLAFASLIPLSGWDNYYAHMARRLEDEKGFFADKRIKYAFHKEIDVFYRLEGFRYVGYLFGVARKK